ncbi:uncharacterized protein BJ212DRAFT_286781 [Suillus subaureus]|uniref:Nucleoporin POM33 n=1 Tax=Suillus subaureus TaxID=48587 RepID=A0A9P7JJD9_9AGAM|nr:uncharacterized protein BJ212DRAFT_286781 [Suillus subaureus]KAG1825628.1 hypothetical protein BJ212DRAFT_286781 [Suillus subaureus]
MATTQHYLWAGGHFLLLLSGFRYLLAWIMFKSVSSWWYKASFLGALMSYFIVCQKALGSPQPNMAYVRRALADENVQYFLLAIFWWTSRPVTIALLPYFVFSLFHALTFTRTTLMPQFLPPGPPLAAGGPPQPHPLAKKLHLWVKANYDTAMRIVAITELVIFARVLFGALLLRNSLMMPLVYANFLHQRYFHSQFTRDAITLADKRITDLSNHPSVPPVVGQVWMRARELVVRWGGSAVVEPAAARRD